MQLNCKLFKSLNLNKNEIRLPPSVANIHCRIYKYIVRDSVVIAGDHVTVADVISDVTDF